MRSHILAPRKILTLFLVSGIIGVSCSHKLAPEGHYQDTPVVADGDPSDWKLPLRFTNEGYTVQYNVTNDNNNLYICVTCREVNTQLRILRAGITLYFDPKGDKNKDISRFYPQRKQRDPTDFRARNSGSESTNPDNKSWREELLVQSDYY